MRRRWRRNSWNRCSSRRCLSTQRGTFAIVASSSKEFGFDAVRWQSVIAQSCHVAVTVAAGGQGGPHDRPCFSPRAALPLHLGYFFLAVVVGTGLQPELGGVLGKLLLAKMVRAVAVVTCSDEVDW